MASPIGIDKDGQEVLLLGEFSPLMEDLMNTKNLQECSKAF